MGTFALLTLAMAPPVALMYFIYWMDRHEPESLKNVIKAMGVGALSTIPAIIIQLSFQELPLFNLGGLAGGFFDAFLLVAPSEELSKFLFIYLFIKNKPFYDEINDGIVYYGAGALGFALLENVFYVLDYGFSIGILRAFTSIPIHTFCGIIVGYHAGLARFTDQLKPGRLILRGLFIAYLTHALYNTLVSAENLLAILFIPLVAVVYYSGLKILHRGRRLSVAGGIQVQAEVPTGAGSSRLSAASAALDDHSFAGRLHPVTNYLPGDVLADRSGRRYLIPKKEKWKAFISRTLLIATALLWLLAFFAGDAPPEDAGELALGMIVLTIIPFMVGLLLEFSYQRRKRSKIYID
ncbi:MAG: PrsW family glutamic-type intramembrane protease [Dethiobacteria bacterium]|nr:PrsW family glutamic-type intramembrane protease [Dethiobacteria bacterium]